MKQVTSIRVSDEQHEVSQWRAMRKYIHEALEHNFQNDDGLLVSISFHTGLAHETGPMVREIVHPLIFNSLNHCWNAANEIILGKRTLNRFTDDKRSVGRGLFCVETRSRDGSKYVGPHIHGVVFFDASRRLIPNSTADRMTAKLTRIYRKIWPDVNVDVRPLLNTQDRVKAVKYATKEHGALTNTCFREGAF